MTRNKLVGIICILAGVLLAATALLLLQNNRKEDAAAGGFFMKRSWSVFLISEKKRLMRTGLNG